MEGLGSYRAPGAIVGVGDNLIQTLLREGTSNAATVSRDRSSGAVPGRSCARGEGRSLSGSFTSHLPARRYLRRRAEPTIVNRMVQYSPTVDRAFAALADPTRRAVLERLGFGSATISELAEPFGMSLTGMRKHIRLLEEAELVTTEKVGRVRRCMLAPYAFEGISTWLQRLDRFAQVVERTKGDR
jgi:DNA-binding transcriptional ArsR family regulator